MKNKLVLVPFSVPSLVFVDVDFRWMTLGGEVRDSSRQAEGRYISSVVGKFFLIVEIVSQGSSASQKNRLKVKELEIKRGWLEIFIPVSELGNILFCIRCSSKTV